jgi:hypothetical protein
MASCRSPKWRTLLHRLAPWLFSTCPGYNRHWRWDKYCCCVSSENGAYHAIRYQGEWLTAYGNGGGGIEWRPRAPWQPKGTVNQIVVQ